jgi:PP-loop superfamily ATP-utilizing enzyme
MCIKIFLLYSCCCVGALVGLITSGGAEDTKRIMDEHGLSDCLIDRLSVDLRAQISNNTSRCRRRTTRWHQNVSRRCNLCRDEAEAAVEVLLEMAGGEPLPPMI